MHESQTLNMTGITTDSLYSWLVCGAAFCTLFVTLGIHYSCGVVFVALLDSLKESRSKTGVVVATLEMITRNLSVCP